MRKNDGFTLIELLVVVGIVTIIGSIVLANLPDFKNVTVLQQEVGNMAFAFRRVQQYAISVRRFEAEIFTVPAGSCTQLYQSQFPAYGISAVAGATQYGLYSDPDCTMVAGDFSGDLVDMLILKNKIQIQSICVDIDSAVPQCGIGAIDVWYIRPGPDIVFKIIPDDGNPHASAKIVLGLPSGVQKSVVLRTSGQVSLED